MDIIFLDQNKWIEFAKIEAKKDVSCEILSLYENLIDAVKEGKAIFPLTFSNIIETSKRNDPKSRLHLVLAQERLSKGLVFKPKKNRLLVEMCNALKNFFGEQISLRPDNWVIDGFMQSNENFDSILLNDIENETLSFAIRHSNPQSLYINSMMNSNDTARREVHKKMYENSEALLERIEQRILNDSSYPEEVRKKIMQQKYLRITKRFSRKRFELRIIPTTIFWRAGVKHF